MAQLCDVFFRMKPLLCDDVDSEYEFTVKTVPITDAFCPQELRHSPLEYSLCLMQRNACIQLLYTLKFPYTKNEAEHIDSHYGEIDMDRDWVEKLALSSESSETPGPARPSETIPRSEKARLAFPVLEDPSIAWDTLADVGLKLKASRKWSHDLARATFMLRVEVGNNFGRNMPNVREEDEEAE
ncbi:hypothetical protein KEM56_007510 [Ascosphaera pollenicola]|nr:hypothetical protein KEM56_007510 [Ascosphaera pollenicola]